MGENLTRRTNRTWGVDREGEQGSVSMPLYSGIRLAFLLLVAMLPFHHSQALLSFPKTNKSKKQTSSYPF